MLIVQLSQWQPIPVSIMKVGSFRFEYNVCTQLHRASLPQSNNWKCYHNAHPYALLYGFVDLCFSFNFWSYGCSCFTVVWSAFYKYKYFFLSLIFNFSVFFDNHLNSEQSRENIVVLSCIFQRTIANHYLCYLNMGNISLFSSLFIFALFAS